MKCYRTFEAWRRSDGTMEYSDYIAYYWANSRNEARLKLYREFVEWSIWSDGAYTDCRAVRVPELDGEPLTPSELYERGYYADEG